MAELDLDRLIDETPAATKTAAVDLDKLIDETPSARAAPKVGPGETFINSAANTLPLGKQVVDSISTGLLQALRPSPGATVPAAAKADARARGIELPEQPKPSILETYRQARDERDRRTAAGEEQNPWTARAGKATGVALSMLAPLPKVAVGTGATGRVLSNALTGGAYGTVLGAANSRGDLTRGEVGQVLSDAAGVDGLRGALQDAKEGHYGRAALDFAGAGGVGGLFTGGALGGLAEGTRAAVAPLANKLAASTRETALSQGRRVLTSGADSLSKRAPVSDAAVETTIREGAMPAFSTTKKVLEKLQGLTETHGDRYAKIVADLEARGVQGPRVRELADKLMSEALELDQNTLNTALPDAYASTAGKLEKLGNADGRLGLKQAENLKRSLQQQAKFGRIEETPLNEARRDMSSTLRRANEDAIAEAADAPGAEPGLKALAEQFGPVKQKLGSLLEAEAAATRGAARAAQRNHFGLKDIAAAGGAIASGHGMLAAPAAMVSNFANTRLPSAVASLGLKASDFLQAGKYAPILQEAAKRGVPALLGLHQALKSQQDYDPKPLEEALKVALSQASP